MHSRRMASVFIQREPIGAADWLTVEMRLDQAIAAKFPEISRRKARELIAAARVLVNQRSVPIASRHVNPSDELAIVEDTTAIPLIAITGDWLAVNKHAGMPAQARPDRSVRSLEE